MASNHVHVDNFHPQQGGRSSDSNNSHPLYSNSQDLAGYGSFFGDAHHQQLAPNFNPSTNITHQPWQQHQQHQQQQQQQQQQTPGQQQQQYQQNIVNPAFNNHALYGRSFSNSPVPYREGVNNDGHRGFTQPAVDPSLVAGSGHTNYGLPLSSYPNVNQSGSIAPSALQSHHTYANNGATSQMPLQRQVHGVQSYQFPSGPPNGQPSNAAPPPRPQFPRAPQSRASGSFFIIEENELKQATNTEELAEFVFIGHNPIELNINRTTIPQYIPRKSRKELKLLAAGNKSLLDRITRRPAKQPKDAKARIRVSHSSTAARKSSGSPMELSSSSETDSDDSEDDSSDEEETSPLPTTRPKGALDSVRYDTIKAVWLSRQDGAQADRIRTALVDYWEVIRTIRDRWKADSTAVKEAEAKEKLGEVELFKDRVKVQRDIMEVALKTALEHGHPEVVRLLGEMSPFVFACYSFLAERIRDTDYTSSLGNTIIEMLTSTTSLTTETMEKTKLAKALTLFAKKGDDRIKAKIKTIQDNAANAAKQKVKSSTPVPDQTSGANHKSDQTRRAVPEPVLGTKRPRGEGDGGPPAKRSLSGSGTPTSNVLPGTGKPTQKRLLSGATTTEKATSTAATASMAKPKVGPKAAPSYVLQSASKKASTTSMVTKKTQPISVTAKKPVTTIPQKPAFSFSDTMAQILKPKDLEPAAKQEDKRPPETKEERVKRLRKEERRKLRVTFKPDAALCSIRYFEHDPDEELGHDASMVRDAGDVHGEGRMFKQKHKEMMDNDDDEDAAPEESYREWKVPTAIDFSDLDEAARSSNYVPFGGGTKLPVSPDKETQEKYEANNLMVYYHNPADIPPSPKEPSEIPSGATSAILNFGAPLERTLKRAAALQPQAAQPPANNGALPQDLSAILDSLKTHQNLSNQSQAATPMQQDSTYQPAAQPVMQLATQAQNNPNQLSQLLSSFATPAAQSKPAPDMQAFLGNLLAQSQTQAQIQQIQPPFPAQGMPFPHPSMPQNDPQALLAFLTSQVPASASAQQPLHHSQDQQFEDFKRKRNDGNQGGYGKKPKWDPDNPPNRFTKPCAFFQEGKCNKGDRCTYRHDM